MMMTLLSGVRDEQTEEDETGETQNERSPHGRFPDAVEGAESEEEEESEREPHEER